VLRGREKKKTRFSEAKRKKVGSFAIGSLGRRAAISNDNDKKGRDEEPPSSGGGAAREGEARSDEKTSLRAPFLSPRYGAEQRKKRRALVSGAVLRTSSTKAYVALYGLRLKSRRPLPCGADQNKGDGQVRVNQERNASTEEGVRKGQKIAHKPVSY